MDSNVKNRPFIVGGSVLGEQSWATPRRLFASLHREFDFTVDVCASEWNAKLPRFIDEKRDGLKTSWAGERVWCNPPFQDPAPWLRRGLAHALYGLAPSVFIVPAATGTRWFLDVAMLGQVWLFRGRVKFEAPIHVSDKQRPSFSPCIVLFEPHAKRRGVVGVRCPLSGMVIDDFAAAKPWQEKAKALLNVHSVVD